MNNIIKVNGYTIDPEKVAMLDRTTRREFSDAAHDFVTTTGIYMRFSAGGAKWVADPEARFVEDAFERFDFGKTEDYLPY